MDEKKKRSNDTLDGAGDWERAWQYHKELDAILAWRIGYLVIAQAALIAGFSALFASQRDEQVVRIAQYVICVLGIAFVLVQWVISTSVTKRLAYLREHYLLPLCPIYRLDAVSAPLPHDEIQSVGLPVALWVIWVILFELALPI